MGGQDNEGTTPWWRQLGSADDPTWLQNERASALKWVDQWVRERPDDDPTPRETASEEVRATIGCLFNPDLPQAPRSVHAEIEACPPIRGCWCKPGPRSPSEAV